MSRNVERVRRYIEDDARLRKESEIPAAERLFGQKLNEAGKNAFFEEYFNGIKLENQEIASIGPFADPRTTKSFKTGYQRGPVLVNAGLVPEKYQNIEDNKKTR